MISKEQIEDIRTKVDIVDWLEKRGTHFKTAGENLVGLCPVHSERSPSFNVRPSIQRFNCFGCGISGDIFSLVEVMESLTFIGAVQYIAEEIGMKLTDAEEDEKYRKTKRLYEICDITSALFRHNFMELPESHPAKQNLADRNLLDYAMTDKMIGYASNAGLMALLTKAGYTTEEMLEAGVVVLTQNSNEEATSRFNSMNKGEVKDKFRNRLMWTLCDISGRPIGFSGRIIYESENNKAPKYLNSPATPIFVKSSVLLNIQAAKKEIVRKQEVIVVEGQTDVDALVAAGIENVVATCGTAFGGTHANILHRLANTGKEAEKFRFVFCFDGDKAGVKAAETVFSKIPEIQLNSYVASMTPQDENGNTLFLDPCDVRLKFGDEKLLELLDKQVSLIEFILKQEQKKWDTTTPEGRTGFTTAAKAHISYVKDPLQYDAYLRKISFWSGVPYSQLQSTGRIPAAKQQMVAPENQKLTVHNLPVEDRLTAFLLQYPVETKKAFNDKKVTPSFFNNADRIQAAWADGGYGYEPIRDGDELDDATKMEQKIVHELTHIDLEVSEGRVTSTITHLLENFLQVKYREELANLNARLASASSDENTITDGSILLEMINQQNELKKKYSR